MAENEEKLQPIEKQLAERLSGEALKKRQKYDAGETRILANRVAYKAERISGYVQGQNWENDIDADKDLAYLPIQLHKNQLEEAEEALDVLCSIYDEINNNKLEQYSLQRVENIGMATPKLQDQKPEKYSKIPQPQKGKTRDLKPYYLEIAKKRSEGQSGHQICKEYQISSSVLHYIMKRVRKANPGMFLDPKEKPISTKAKKQIRRNLKPFYEDIAKMRAEGKSLREIGKKFKIASGTLVGILKRIPPASRWPKPKEKIGKAGAPQAQPSKFICNKCNNNGVTASFVNRSFLQKHLHAHRWGKIDEFGKLAIKTVKPESYIPPQQVEVVETVEETPPPKIIICRKCTQTFINQSAFAKHRWIHIKEDKEKAKQQEQGEVKPDAVETETKKEQTLEETLLQPAKAPNTITSEKQ